MDPLVSVQFAQSNIKIRCERRLPRPGDTTVRVGNTVAPNQVVARIPEQVAFHIVPANELLGVPPAAVHDYLQVDIGDNVQLGMLLLKKKSMFGTKTVTAPVAGQISAVQNGRIILESVGRITELRAMVKGRVASFVGNHTVVIETQGTLLQGVWSTGIETFGPLKMTSDYPDDPLFGNSISQHNDHILVAGTITSESVLEQAAAEEVKGLIIGTLSARLCQVAQKLQLPLILTDGIGDYPMSQHIFELLRQWEGHETSLLIATGRYQRPEIIIPHKITTGEAQPLTYHPLATGQPVRLLRQPYQGQIGQVVKLFHKARTTEIGIKAHGAMVAISTEQAIFVPYANMEAIL